MTGRIMANPRIPEDVIVGWMSLDTVSVMKEMDSVSWDLAKQEWIDREEQEENIVSFDNGANYYWMHEAENLLIEKGF